MNDLSVARFIERFAAVLEESGVPRMPARVFVALLAEDSGSLTAAQLAQRLQVSPAAISGAVRYLTQVSLVGREREPGSRPNSRTVPAVGRIRPSIIRSEVVLPAPLGPR